MCTAHVMDDDNRAAALCTTLLYGYSRYIMAVMLFPNKDIVSIAMMLICP